MLRLFAVLTIFWFSTIQSQVIYISAAATWNAAEADCMFHSMYISKYGTL